MKGDNNVAFDRLRRRWEAARPAALTASSGAALPEAGAANVQLPPPPPTFLAPGEPPAPGRRRIQVSPRLRTPAPRRDGGGVRPVVGRVSAPDWNPAPHCKTSGGRGRGGAPRAAHFGALGDVRLTATRPSTDNAGRCERDPPPRVGAVPNGPAAGWERPAPSMRWRGNSSQHPETNVSVRAPPVPQGKVRPVPKGSLKT